MSNIIQVNRDNIIELQLQTNGRACDLGNVDRMVITVEDIVIDSASYSNLSTDPIYWTTGIPSINQGNLFLRLGNISGMSDLVEGNYTMELTVFDFDNPNGLLWFDDFIVNIKNNDSL